MRQLILFLAKYRSTLLLIVFVLIALLRHSLKNPVAEHRLNNVGFGTIASVHNGLSGWKQYWRLEAINEELARENAALRSGGTRASANHFSNSTDYDFIPARVVDYSYTKRNNYIIVHAGRRDGIQPGMGAMTPDGWVGSVVEVSDAYAHIIPVLHSKGNIGARIPEKGWVNCAGTVPILHGPHLLISKERIDPYPAIVCTVLRVLRLDRRH